MRAIVLTCVLVVACGRPSPAVVTPAPTREPGVLEVTVLLDLSGDRAPKGDAQRNAIQVWTDIRSSRGGPRVQVKIVDVASSDARVLIELRRAAEVDRADAVVVGTPAPALAGALEVARLPVLFTLPIQDPAQEPGGRWGFALAPTPEQLARYAAAALPPSSGTLLFLLREGRPLDPETAAVLDLYDDGPAKPVLYRWDRERGDLAAPLRGLLTPTSRVYVSGAAREYRGVVEGARAAFGATFLLSWSTDPSDLGDFRDASLDARWPGPRPLDPESAGTPAATERAAFASLYRERHGTPSAHAAAAYDALTILEIAAKRAGIGDRERLRGEIERHPGEGVSLAGVATGVATTYSFSADRHAGFAYEDLGLFRWDGSAAGLATPRPAISPSPPE